MNSTPTFELIIPTTPAKYDYLRKTLDCLLEQYAKPSRIFVLVDVKSWDRQWFFPSSTANVLYFMGGTDLKRQHEMVTRFICDQMDPEKIILLMDDDYTTVNRDAVRLMAETIEACDLVVPSHVTVRPSGEKMRVFDDPSGHNPWSGHPKIFRAKLFQGLGGFRWQTYPHYGWCDTDLWMRFKDAAYNATGIDNPWETVEHARPDRETFCSDNAATFVSQWGSVLAPDHPYLALARKGTCEPCD